MVWWWWQMMNEVDGMKQEEYSKDCVMHTEWAICDFERGRRGWTRDGDEWWWTSAARKLNRDQVIEISRLSSRESCMSEREFYIRYVRWLSASGEILVAYRSDMREFGRQTVSVLHWLHHQIQ